MSIIIKIYQSKLISEVLTAPGLREVKNGINNTFSSLKTQNVGDGEVLKLVDHTMKELRTLNQSKLSYDQHANIISAKEHLKQLQLEMINVID